VARVARTLIPDAADVGQADNGQQRRTLSPPDAKAIRRRFEAARSVRENWKSLWEDCYTFALPQRNTLASSGKGAAKGAEVYDSTAIDATQNFGSELQMALMPPFRRFIRLVAGTDIPPEHRQEINTQLEDQTRILFEALDHSNLATSAAESFLDLAIGTGALLCQDSGDGFAPLRFTSVPLSQLALEPGPGSTVETVFREFEMPVRNILRTWPQGRLSPQLAAAADGDPDREVKVIEGTIYEPKEKLYRYVVLEGDGNHIIVHGAMDTSPWIIFRWLVVPGEVFGRGPLLTCLPDIKTANRVVELTLRNAALSVAGVWKGVDDGVLNPWTVTIEPGAIIPVMSPDSLTPLDRGGDFNVGQLILEDLRKSIRDKLFVEEMPSLEGQPRTATEIQVRQQRLVRRAASAFGRLQNELVFALVQRATDILVKRGKMAPIKLDGSTVDAHFLGPLAGVQNKEDVAVIEGYMALVGQLGPEIAMSTTKIEDLPAHIADKLGIPSELIRTKREREEIVQKATQVAAQTGELPPEAAAGSPGEPPPPMPEG
jgi:hypothetical protein